jgi:hypothetical protein
MNRLSVCLCLSLALAASLAAPVLAGRLSNPAASVTLDPASHFAITEIASNGVNRIATAPTDKPLNRSPWLLTVRQPDGNLLSLSASDAARATEAVTGQALTITWTGVGAAQGCDLTVRATMRLSADGASRWRLNVTGTAPGVLWQADFPRLALRPLGEDFLAVPLYLGRLVRDPHRQPVRYGIGYPSPLSMQFMATWGTSDRREPPAEPVTPGQSESGWLVGRQDAHGLLWAAADREFHYKRLAVDSQTVPGVLQAWVEHVPAVPAWPLPAQPRFQIAYELPYDVLIQPFTGDAYTACDLYRGLGLAGPLQKPAGTTDPAYHTPD